MIAVKIITVSTVSSAIVYLKNKFNNFFRKVESSSDSDSEMVCTKKEMILL